MFFGAGGVAAVHAKGSGSGTKGWGSWIGAESWAGCRIIMGGWILAVRRRLDLGLPGVAHACFKPCGFMLAGRAWSGLGSA